MKRVLGENRQARVLSVFIRVNSVANEVIRLY